MAKFNPINLIILAQLVFVISSVAALPVETFDLNERAILEPRGKTLRHWWHKAQKGLKWLGRTGEDVGRQAKQEVEEAAYTATNQVDGYVDSLNTRDLENEIVDLGNRGLGEDGWSELDAREFLDVDELD